MSRKGLSKKVRFEVFKRDSFRCQYCGSAAPDAVLRVDHIKPVAKGGDNSLINLVTACHDCNAGKSDRELSDDTVVAKQMAQLAEINERREQLKMIATWREQLSELENEVLETVRTAWETALCGAYTLNDHGMKSLKQMIKRFGVSAVLEAIDIATDKYLVADEEKTFTHESVDLAWKRVGGICATRQKPEWEQQIFYIRGILRRRFGYVHWADAYELLLNAQEYGYQFSDLKALACEARSWREWKDNMFDMIARCEAMANG